jgi:DNA-binding LacI/PurR family transcriptional regulator
VKDWAVEGILMIVPVTGLPFQDVQAICGNTPVVQIDAARLADIPSVVLDDAYGTEQIIEHLLSLGHRHFCEISGPQNWFGAKVRHQTCIKVFQSYGLEPPVSMQANWSTSGGYRAMKRLLEREIPVTAVISANDNMALGALRALQEAGLTVPQDVSLVGFDDVPEAAFFTPPLTTVRQSYVQLGMTAFEYLMRLMDDPDTPLQQHIISPKVIFRESTGIPSNPCG